jgi:hypothetical protein
MAFQSNPPIKQRLYYTLSRTSKEFYGNQADIMSAPEKCECLKRVMKYTAQQYSQEYHKNNKILYAHYNESE